MYENEIKLVFTRMFDFLISPKLVSMQGLFHSYRFILYFFGQVMHICKSTCLVLQK